MHESIRAVEERQQLLHHCAVWDLQTGALVVGDSHSNIIQATVVDFDFETLESYVAVIDDIKNEFLLWAYDDDEDVPKEVIEVAKTIGE